ncbi:MAG: ATP-binding protein [Cyclobacteriaceae bacterium]
MAKENQNIEWKESWRDEYLKWICGFANAQGGKLYIGMNDKGSVTGLSDAQKLLEEIPNKVKDILGIIVNVNLHSKSGKEFLEIEVESYPYPISYKGQYHYRTGSTKQELKGAALDKFLLQKQGKRWDSVPVPQVKERDLSASAFTYFRGQAARSKRLSNDVLTDSNANLLDKLHLLDGKALKRAAVLLFHPAPEKYITGAFIKIGYFKSDADLAFQDTLHGNLFEQVEKAMDLLLTKYLKAGIRYEGLNRVEDYPYPEAALREALLNAVAHKDYSQGHPIQISVYDEKIIFWNEGELPEKWTANKLKVKHPSRPFNPDIASTFFGAGLIEAWGRGTLKIIAECKQAGLPLPVFSAEGSDVNVTLKARKSKTVEKTVEKTALILQHLEQYPTATISQLQQVTGLTRRGVEYNLEKLKAAGNIKRIGADRGGRWQVLNKLL